MTPSQPVMIMGCTSDAGKSFLVAALCRYLSNLGVRVAPFKAQNMSNNAAVTPDGDEIGRAQFLQAMAARVTPQARMNPILLQPSSDTYSQVIVMGRPAPGISKVPWMERRARLWPVVHEALHSLIADYDRVIIEGAGSPAEINLREGDIVNMSVALECQADVYLVADIDRGGAFAHLLGTWHCLSDEERKLLKGFVLNKFRGDQKLLGNAMDWLEERTGIPTVAIIPMIHHELPEEDTFHYRAQRREDQISIALVVYPYASNLDEFDPLINEAHVNVVPVRDLAQLNTYDAILLPGSKNSSASLRYLRETGLAAEISRAAQRGIPVVGICGGMQILGQQILDPYHLESGDCPGLGLLDLTTTLGEEKVTRQREIMWNGKVLSGYEIYHGLTQASETLKPYLPDGLGWRDQNVLGVYLHGLFENGSYRRQFLESLGWMGEEASNWSETIKANRDRVAQLIPDSGWVI